MHFHDQSVAILQHIANNSIFQKVSICVNEEQNVITRRTYDVLAFRKQHYISYAHTKDQTQTKNIAIKTFLEPSKVA